MTLVPHISLNNLHNICWLQGVVGWVFGITSTFGLGICLWVAVSQLRNPLTSLTAIQMQHGSGGAYVPFNPWMVSGALATSLCPLILINLWLGFKFMSSRHRFWKYVFTGCLILVVFNQAICSIMLFRLNTEMKTSLRNNEVVIQNAGRGVGPKAFSFAEMPSESYFDNWDSMFQSFDCKVVGGSACNLPVRIECSDGIERYNEKSADVQRVLGNVCGSDVTPSLSGSLNQEECRACLSTVPHNAAGNSYCTCLPAMKHYMDSWLAGAVLTLPAWLLLAAAIANLIGGAAAVSLYLYMYKYYGGWHWHAYDGPDLEKAGLLSPPTAPLDGEETEEEHFEKEEDM